MIDLSSIEDQSLIGLLKALFEQKQNDGSEHDSITVTHVVSDYIQ